MNIHNETATSEIGARIVTIRSKSCHLNKETSIMEQTDSWRFISQHHIFSSTSEEINNSRSLSWLNKEMNSSPKLNISEFFDKLTIGVSDLSCLRSTHQATIDIDTSMIFKKCLWIWHQTKRNHLHRWYLLFRNLDTCELISSFNQYKSDVLPCKFHIRLND